jgi:hypothetical protein
VSQSAEKITLTSHLEDSPGFRESRRAPVALRDYLQLGPGRSLAALLDLYKTSPAPPTRSARTLRAWARRYDWPERASCHDEYQRSSRLSAESERQQAAMQTGLAQTCERVESLKLLYSQLQTYLERAWPVWLADLHESGSHARVARFNTAIIIQMRGILDDLARETGGRAASLLAKVAITPGQLPDLRRLSQDELDNAESVLQKLLSGPES